MLFDARDLSRVRTPLLLVAAAAWLVLLAAPHHASMGVPCAMHAPGVVASAWAARWAAGWALMLVAMMAPALIVPLHQLRVRSLARRRGRTLTLFVAAYAAIWLAAGGAVLLVALVMVAVAPQPSMAAAGALVAAVVWQCSPFKQRCLNRCHALPALAAFGRAADVDALRFGARHGVWCVASCWALMLVPVLLPGGHVVAMAAVTVLVGAERLERPQLPSWRLRGLGQATRIVAWRVRAMAA